MDISIVICTHNPEERVFRRCLDAVNRLNLLNVKTEILIVDNNSSPTLIARDYVNKFLKDTPSAKCILEKKPGLTYARMTGNNEAKAPVVIFFDDDNEPDQNYALAAHTILLEKKEVGIIGPGVVKVDFVDGSDAWLETQRPFFQEMSVEKELYSNNQMYYEKCYPYGTGLVVRKKILENYHSILCRNGEISDRTGNMLVSGGDKQIVLCGIKMGYFAGRTPLLKMNHIIPQARTSKSYIKKLSYFLGYSHTKTQLGIFPENRDQIKSERKSFLDFSLLIVKYSINNFFDPKKLFISYFPNVIGETSGYYFAFKERKPRWLCIVENMFGLNYQQ